MSTILDFGDGAKIEIPEGSYMFIDPYQGASKAQIIIWKNILRKYIRLLKEKSLNNVIEEGKRMGVISL